jgi:RNA polymerase sigma factor (sigma-70 family)
MEESNYIAAILKGDRADLLRLYELQFPIIRSLIRNYGGSEADAKDIFQDAVLVVYQKAQQPDFHLSSKFSTFFYGICRNLWLNRRTKKSASYEVTYTDAVKSIGDDSSLDEDLLYVEQGNLFWSAFRKLEEDCKKLLELFFQKIPMEVIAVQMGYGSGGYAKRRKLQCKDRLTELVKKDPAYRELI